MIEITKTAAQASIKATVKDGYTVSEKGVRTPYVGGGGLPLGEYTPVMDIQPAVNMDPRSEGGSSWDALRYNMNGRTWHVAISHIMYKTRIVIDAGNIRQGDKWQGEEVQPTKEVWRYGRTLRDMPSKEEGKTGVYATPGFALTTRVWMVVPEFEVQDDGSRRSIYTVGCKLREISIVADEEATDA